ncbi:MAG: hypothetical protein GEU89_20960 [Kiloniellaceae bacterium]|nr:hypothetical protein [Kiloniellaceae bacterium]
MRLNEEVNLIVHDAAVAGELEKAFHEDLKHSKKLNYEDWQSRPWSEKILELFTIPMRQPEPRLGHRQSGRQRSHLKFI